MAATVLYPVGRPLFNVLAMVDRVRGRPNPPAHHRGHAGRQGPRAVRVTSTQAQPATRGEPGQAVPSRRTHRLRARKPVRHHAIDGVSRSPARPTTTAERRTIRDMTVGVTGPILQGEAGSRGRVFYRVNQRSNSRRRERCCHAKAIVQPALWSDTRCVQHSSDPSLLGSSSDARGGGRVGRCPVGPAPSDGCGQHRPSRRDRARPPFDAPPVSDVRVPLGNRRRASTASSDRATAARLRLRPSAEPRGPRRTGRLPSTLRPTTDRRD